MIDFERNVSLFSESFNKFLSENTVLNGYDDRTYYHSLSESDKFNVSDKLIAALYKSSMEKYAIIDFGKIPDSKGDIDRLEHINEINNVVTTMTQIAPDMPELAVIKDTLALLATYKKEFCLGFIQDVPMIVMTYNTTVLSLFTAISLAMNICLDYLRTPGGSIQASSNTMYKSNSQYNVVIMNLTKLNTASQKGDLKKVFEACLKKDNFIGSSIGVGIGSSVGAGAIAGVALVASAILIIPTIRELLYFSYNYRMNMSQFFKTQAEFLQINVAELRSSNNPKNAPIIKRQEQRIKSLEKLSNKFEVEFNSANEKTRRDLQQKIDTDMIKTSLSSEKDDISSFSLL